MNAISVAEARDHLEITMDRVCREHDPVVIRRGGQDEVVLLSLADYESMTETAYLFGNSVNAARLTEAINQLKSGGGTERTLVE